MDNASAMCDLNGLRQRRHHRRGLARGLGDTGETLGKRPAVDEFHREIRPAVEIADIMNLHDVRIVQGGNGAGFAHEARELHRAGVFARAEHFHGHRAIELEMARTKPR